MPANAQSEQYQILTVRLVPDDMQRLKEAAEHIGVGPTVLARVLIRQGLQGNEGASRFPFAALRSLLAPLAAENGLTDKEVSQRVKQVRRKHWKSADKRAIQQKCS